MTTTITDHLRGPWQAVLSWHGDVLPEDELAYLEDSDEVNISIRRRSALPDEHGSLPGVSYGGDVIEVARDLYVGDRTDDDGVDARWAQAQAMAAGLNAAVPAEVKA